MYMQRRTVQFLQKWGNTRTSQFGRYHGFIHKKTGRVLKTTEEQMILLQVWRIPREKISINTLNKRPEETTGVYAKEDCSIPTGMGKYIPVQINCEITRDILIEISDKTIPGLVLHAIVHNIRKKLGCLFVDNHSSKSMGLK